MQWYWSAAGLVMAAGAPILAVLAWSAARQRPAAAGRGLALFLAGVSFWSLAYALELSGPDLGTIRFWGDVKYLGIVLLPPAWLVFVLHYIDRRQRLARWHVALLLIEPTLVLALLANGATHDLVRSYPDLQPGLDLPSAATGPLFLVHAAYTWGLLLFGSVLLVRGTLRASPVYRRQGLAVAITLVVCLLSSVLYNFGPDPFRRVDVSPFALLALGVVMLWGVLRHGLVPLVPVARHTVFERMADGVVVLDGYWRVIDLNPAARVALGLGPGEGKGLPAGALLGLDDLLDGGGPTVERHAEATLGPPGHERDYDLVLSPLRGPRGDAGGHVLVLRDVTERKRAEEQLALLALSDQLTGLANRKQLHERLALLARDGTAFTLLFCDLDRFKRINDTLGHDIGDRVLVEIAERLRAVVPRGALVARLGGDEFVVVVIDADGETAAIVGRGIVNAVARPLHVGPHELYLTVSVGLCRSPERGRDPTTLLRLADLAMYRAKGRGGNRVAFHVDRVQEARLDRLQLERDLHAFRRHDELELWYQPITSLRDGSCVGMEALLRWRHPRRGLLHPELFIPVAEQTDLMGSLGSWVLDVACAQAVRWGGELLPEPRHLAVNVSARQFEPSFARRVARVLDRTGLDPSMLTLEITETAVLHGGEETLRILRDLKRLGVRLATDDFGTGYNSLEQLRHYPLDVVKIDRSFVAGLPRRGEDASIVAAVISLAHDLGMRVVAEGVETEAQADLLRELRCDDAQGFLFAEPLPPPRAAAYLVSAS